MTARAFLPILVVAFSFGLVACDDEGGGDTIVTETVAYQHGEVELEGFLAYDKGLAGKRPGVLVVHEWWGLADHPKERAKRLAGLGYVAFCVDMYGKGKVTDDPAQARAWSGAFRKDVYGLGRARIKAGYDVLAANPLVDKSRIGAIGFCFGGTVALELAWSGADVKAVVSFHGGLTAPREEDVPNVKSSILVCHGANDGFVSEEQMDGFVDSMKAGKFDWCLVEYGNSVHAFTNKAADAYGIPGIAYNAKADARSWEHMKAFLAETLGR
jgi:dienelactone hydrolase